MTEGASPAEPRDRWRRIEEVLGAALERAPSERDAYLDEACAGDAALRDEVASLLAAHDRTGVMDRLAADLAPLGARVRGTAAPLVGLVVGRYHVLEPVGGGGMGVVYKATDGRLGRTVALKFLRSRFDADDSAAQRFRQEARTVAGLEHPNICTVHEIGETDDGQLFLAMPLYDGETLQRRIARGPLPIDEAVAIAVQIARGLGRAHSRGVVHRDVKPSNVFVTDDGVVKVLDFGIAKLADADITLTGAGGPLGTVAYMSPEQASGETVDHRTDLWSLGVVLYEMLAGVRPFQGGPPAAVIAAIQRASPAPVRTHRPDVPPGLVQVIARLIARSPDARYDSAHELENDLLMSDLAPVAAGNEARTEPETPPAPSPRRGRRVARGAIAAAAVALAAGGAWLATARLREPATGTPPATARAMTAIAVLPFADRSPQRDQAYFSDGITDELIATLARVDGLRVVSRTSAFAFKDRGVDVRTVGAQLGVSTVLEGSVRREGDRVRISAQLVDVANGYQLWSETYDRPMDDAFAIQQEIARAIAGTLSVKLVGGATGTSATAAPDSKAYDLYLKGRHAWYRRSEEGLRSAARFLEQAVALEPRWARAHAGLADAYAVLGFYDHLAPSEAFPRAETAARRAIALDATLAAPHTTLAYAALYYHWDLRRGEEEFRRAIALDPSYSIAHQWYANVLTASGRFPEAVREMRRAQEIDPQSVIANAALGWVWYYAADPSAALAQFRQTLEMNPGYGPALLWSGWALQELDSFPQAVALHRRALAADSGGTYVTSLARSLALAGRRAEAESMLRRLEARGTTGRYVPSYEIARVYEALGRTDDAFAWLERARVQRSHSMVFVRVDPQLARLREDARFTRLAARVFPERREYPR